MSHELYPFQRVGVETLKSHPRFMLADSMGLGKTAQALIARRELGIKDVLINVDPTSAKYQWAEMIDEWDPGATWTVVDGWPEERPAQIKSGTDYVIMGYGQSHLHCCYEPKVDPNGDPVKRHLKHDHILGTKRWGLVIFDECHKLKTPRIETTKAAKIIAYNSPRMWLLSGTPRPNYGTELWNLLNLLDKKEFRSFWAFVDRYLRRVHNGFGWNVEDIIDPNAPDYFKTIALAKLLDKWMLRRTKRQPEIAAQLPLKKWEQIKVNLTPEQAQFYNTLEREMIASLSGRDVDSMHPAELARAIIDGDVIVTTTTLALITKLRQVTIDPRLLTDQKLDKDFQLEGPKVDVLLRRLRSLPGKVVIFTNYRAVVTGLVNRLHSVGETAVPFMGGDDKREESRREFKTGPTRFLVSTLAAGGTSLNLDVADTAIFFDKSWTPAVNEQAEDRIHRLSSTSPVVNYLNLTVPNSVESYMDRMLAAKSESFKLTVDRKALNDVHDDES